MKMFQRFYCRVYQGAIRLAMHFMDFHEPERYEGKGAMGQIPAILRKKGYRHPLIVADPAMTKLHLIDPLLSALKKEGFSYSVYDGVVPNPTFDVVLAAKEKAQLDNCDSLIAIGGGSAMDTAKAAGALLANPKASPASLGGILKVHRRYHCLIAIPTTAGTGSEVTVAAVIVNPKTHEKFSINDPKLIPHVAVLDNSLLEGLPSKVISSTGMDALTHAVEAYIGGIRTTKTKAYAIKAVQLIHGSLYRFYSDPHDDEARGNMQLAAYLAGVAFTRSYVGYAHAIAHSLGGQYNVPHGLANAIILPHVLRAYGKSDEKRLAKLSEAIHLTKRSASKEEKAKAFISWIDEMNESMQIPATFDHLIKKEDIPMLSKRAAHEGNPLYPVPKEMDAGELAKLYAEIDPQ
ncbi:MAG: iron-containing alcohol dehydrogenase [Bacilli bacterium]|jgi:alcohol dehydrogenase class IV|nr:iron-containing alcohol dehydrogenase [Bacilli bacterium]